MLTIRPLQAEIAARPLPSPSLSATLKECRQITRIVIRDIPVDSRQIFAQRFTATAIATYWNALQSDYPEPFVLPEPPIITRGDDNGGGLSLQAAAIGRTAAQLDPIAAGYLLGEVYTALLPSELRARHGIYYTPPTLTRRLLALVTAAGVDWTTCRVLDPACGGGAFLTPVALKMVESLAGSPPLKLYRHIGYRLRGAELDPFSAWMSQTLVEAS